ncbi:MAG TPA: GNAT family N-acetyltransferase [Acidimicrobiia bacterium]|nr:GNAT family N-acetyltransferase [Acidimicrobiia bacterium]
MIRPLEPGDVAACGALLDRLADWFGVADANAHYLASLGRVPAFVAVADDDDRGHELIGFLALEQRAEASAEILVMAVDPTSHRHGYGRALVAAAQDWCDSHDMRWLFVKTRGPSTYDDLYARTRRFYTAVGFEPLYESHAEWGPTDAALILVQHRTCARHSADG